MGEALLRYEEAGRALGCSVRHVRRQVRRGVLPAEPLGRHPNGRVEYGIPAVAVDRARSGALAPAGAAPAVSAMAPVADRLPLTHDGLPDVAAMRALGLGAHADEWDRRMRIVSEHLDRRLRAGRGGMRAAARLVAEMHGVSTSTVYSYTRDHRRGGPAALVPAWRSGTPGTTLPPELQRQIRESWLNSRRATVAQVYRDVVLPYYKDQREDPPSRSAVRRFVRKHILPLEAVFWRDGRREYEARVEPKNVRDLPTDPNDWWCADHRLWDVMVVVADGQGAGWGAHGRIKCPCGSGRERRACCSVRRPWVTMIADVASAGWVGWRIGLTPTAAGVCHAVRSAILDCGVPRHWYRDNGREFCARRLGGKADRLIQPRRADLDGRRRWPCALPPDVGVSGIWAALGVEVVTALPYHAWSKPIESYFNAFSHQWENLVPGWTGRDAQDKPEQLDTQIRNGQLLMWDEFTQVFREQVGKWNADHTCGDREGPPLDIYRAWAERGGEPRQVDPATLSFLLQDEREARVQTKGIELRAAGAARRYFSPDLALYVGCTVRVRWDPEDADCVWVYTPDDRVIAVPPALNAQWGEWGEPNRQVKEGGRAQRAYLVERRHEMAGATPPERLDPTGSVAMIEGRTRAHAREREDAVALEDTQRAALEQAEAARLAEEAGRRPRRRRTIYSDLLKDIA